MGKLVGINPTNQLKTAEYASSATCDAYVLSLVKTRLEMPLASNTDLSKAFSALTSSCKVTTLKVTAPATNIQWAVPTSSLSPTRTGSATSSLPLATGTAACVGKIYTILPTDTCASVALSQRISTADLFMANNLPASCDQFPKSGTLCIPSGATCEPHRLKTAPPIDTCEGMAQQANTTVPQLVSWNPSLGPECSNLPHLYDGYTLCFSPPGGAWVDPHPSSTAKATTTSIE